MLKYNHDEGMYEKILQKILTAYKKPPNAGPILIPKPANVSNTPCKIY